MVLEREERSKPEWDNVLFLMDFRKKFGYFYYLIEDREVKSRDYDFVIEDREVYINADYLTRESSKMIDYFLDKKNGRCFLSFEWINEDLNTLCSDTIANGRAIWDYYKRKGRLKSNFIGVVCYNQNFNIKMGRLPSIDLSQRV